jgi:hypothetical protein
MSFGAPPQGPQGPNPYPYQPQGPYAPPGYAQPTYGPAQIDPALEYIAPVNIRNGWAFVSGYLGLFSLILGPLTGVPAIITGIVGLRRPELGNLGRAWTGVIVGGITTFIWFFFILAAVLRG